MLMLAMALVLGVQDTLPETTPGICKAAAQLGRPLAAAVRAHLMAMDREARAGRPSQYSSERIGRMLQVLSREDEEAEAVIARYASVTPTEAELDDAERVTNDERPDFVRACYG